MKAFFFSAKTYQSPFSVILKLKWHLKHISHSLYRAPWQQLLFSSSRGIKAATPPAGLHRHCCKMLQHWLHLVALSGNCTSFTHGQMGTVLTHYLLQWANEGAAQKQSSTPNARVFSHIQLELMYHYLKYWSPLMKIKKKQTNIAPSHTLTCNILTHIAFDLPQVPASDGSAENMESKNRWSNILLL